MWAVLYVVQFRSASHTWTFCRASLHITQCFPHLALLQGVATHQALLSTLGPYAGHLCTFCSASLQILGSIMNLCDLQHVWQASNFSLQASTKWHCRSICSNLLLDEKQTHICTMAYTHVDYTVIVLLLYLSDERMNTRDPASAVNRQTCDLHY